MRTWLYQIARHAIIDMRRRASARPSLAPGEPLLDAASGRDSIEQAMLGWQVASRSSASRPSTGR